METISFDLYLDESGKFTCAGEHTLIGGVLIPHEKNPLMKTMQSWETDIRSRIAQTGIFDNAALIMGDEWHRFYQNTQQLKKITAEGEKRLKFFNESKRYTFNHCSENICGTYSSRKSVQGRWEVQGWILKEYMKKVCELGGFPVVIDNPNGVYHIDSNTTYMAIFASGIVQLYHKLMEQYAGQEIVLYIHAASRLNMTRKYETEKYNISPTAGKEANLERSLYLNSIKNFVFLNGGSDLLDLNGFQESINSFDILEDFTVNGEKTPNPATVVCDYICNCYYSDNPERDYCSIFRDAGLYIIQSFGKIPDLTDAAIQRMAEQHDWFSFLKILISRSFPEKETMKFFSQMKSDSKFNQMNCVNTLVEYLFPFIDGREDMVAWEDRLELIMNKCEGFEKSAYLNLKANLLIYIHALQTHMGKDVSLTNKDFIACINGINNIEQQNALLTLFCNRQIVIETDCFEYAKAEDWFEAIKTFLEKSIENSNDLLTWVSMISGVRETSCRSQQYGKALGSYVQLLTKEIRSLDGEEKQVKQDAAIAASGLAFENLPDKREISRAHQNSCDLYAELCQFETAMEHLYNSLSDERAIGFNKQAEEVLRISGCYGEKNLFAYLHFVYMMHRCFRVGSQYGEVMLDLILKESINIEKVNHLINEPHPQAVILWHLASSLAYRAGRGKMAEELFSYALNAFTDRGEMFWTIKMAVEAEMIALGLENRLRSPQEAWGKRGRTYVEKIYPKYADQVHHNPFIDRVENIIIDSPAAYFSVSDCVVY